MKLLLAIGWGIYIGIIFLACSLLLLASPFLPEPLSSYVIRSGSMEPTIMTGDLVIDRVDWLPATNSVITFYDEGRRLVTHRIIDQQKQGETIFFQTKGDNNEDPDSVLIPATDVVGVWYASFRYFGYIVVGLKRPVVLLTVVFLPLTLLLTLDALTTPPHKKSVVRGETD